MVKKIVSFGFRHGSPPSAVNGSGVVVIDVRKVFTRNPYHDRKLRQLRGTDPAVQADILKTPNFEVAYSHLKEAVMVPGLDIVYLGCTGGHHRSVFLAERLSQELGVPVEHRDFAKK